MIFTLRGYRLLVGQRGRAVDVGALAATDTFDLRDGLGGHRDAAPAAAGELQHGPDQRQRAGLAGQAADDLGAAADLDERALQQVRAAGALAVLQREAQVRDELVDVLVDRLHRRGVGAAVVAGQGQQGGAAWT